ncbi:hypothetical protein [Thomasclavelia sp.]|uniref:hypothetical protein n=1 Tax=Thomasclavelia sp. TaxID=3025757 RepID=UPI0025E19C14|nr:hypothetical protein [Thomasclavelia sp.]
MTKKIILFIVEGLSDKDALEPILAELVDTTKIMFEVLRCDLTTNNSDVWLRNLNMKERVARIVKNFLEQNHGIKKKHIEKIIFLTDMDGCYIDEKYIYYCKDDREFRYEDDGIYTDRVTTAIKRNQMKSRNLNIVNSTREIYNLPFEIYYFSCNLDHVLHDERNLKQSLKEDYAFDFADKYEDKEDEFIDFINDKSLYLSLNYKDSWQLIKVNKNSLLRYTNLNVFFINNIEYMKENAKIKINNYLNKYPAK